MKSSDLGACTQYYTILQIATHALLFEVALNDNHTMSRAYDCSWVGTDDPAIGWCGGDTCCASALTQAECNSCFTPLVQSPPPPLPSPVQFSVPPRPPPPRPPPQTLPPSQQQSAVLHVGPSFQPAMLVSPLIAAAFVIGVAALVARRWNVGAAGRRMFPRSSKFCGPALLGGEDDVEMSSYEIWASNVQA